MTLEDMFTLAELVEAINRLPTLYGAIGQRKLFRSKGIATTHIGIEEVRGELRLVQNISRDEEPTPGKRNQRSKKTFTAMHLPEVGFVRPSDVQGIVGFGQTDTLATQVAAINDELQRMKNNIMATLEWIRVGAVKGLILDAAGETVYDLYEEFGIQKRTKVIDFSNVKLDTKKVALDCKREAEPLLGAQIVTRWEAVCGPDFFDALTSHQNTQAAYANYQAAQDRLGGDMRGGFTHGDVTYWEYNASVGNKRFVDKDKAHVYPVCAEPIFIERYAPANYNETINTLGREFYASAEPRGHQKGWELEAQSNPIMLCTYPGALTELSLK